MGDTPPRGTLGTVHNAALLLHLLADGPSHHQLTDLAERSGMSLATVHRLLRSLVAAELVEQDPRTSRYGLGPELVRLADQYLGRHPIVAIGAPYLVELRNATRGTVVAATLAGRQLVLLDRIDGEDAGGVYRDARRVQDPTQSATGRLLLANAPPEVWNDVAGAAGFTTEDRDDWRKRDLLVHVPASPADRPDAAAPIRTPGGDVIATIGVGGAAAAFTQDVLERSVGPLVVRAAETISRALGQR